VYIHGAFTWGVDQLTGSRSRSEKKPPSAEPMGSSGSSRKAEVHIILQDGSAPVCSAWGFRPEQMGG
jgi:hypothetical protein